MIDETLVLGEERDRLDARLDELVSRLQDANPDTASADVLQHEANDLDVQGRGVSHLIDEYGRDATVTVAGLSAGDFARVEDRAATMRSQHPGPGNLPGSSRNVFAAAVLVEAPFYTGDKTDLDAKISAVAAQPIGVVKWLESKGNDLTSVDSGNWTSFAERVATGRTG